MAFSSDFDMKKESDYFKGTFDLLARTTKENSFRKYDGIKDRFTGGFLVSGFEAVALGIGYNLGFLEKNRVNIEEKVKTLWQTDEFRSGSAGVRASTRTAKVIPLARRLFSYA